MVRDNLQHPLNVQQLNALVLQNIPSTVDVMTVLQIKNEWERAQAFFAQSPSVYYTPKGDACFCHHRGSIPHPVHTFPQTPATFIDSPQYPNPSDFADDTILPHPAMSPDVLDSLPIPAPPSCRPGFLRTPVSRLSTPSLVLRM